MAKKELRIAVDSRVQDMTVIFHVIGSAGKSVLVSNPLEFNAIHVSLRDQVSLYGLKKLLMDRTSEVIDKKEKVPAMIEVYERLVAGEWQKDRVMGAPVVSVYVEALAELKKISVPMAQKALASYDKATREKILANPRVVKLAEEKKALREGALAVNLDDMA